MQRWFAPELKETHIASSSPGAPLCLHLAFSGNWTTWIDFFTERTLINWGNYRWGFSCNTKMGRRGWEEAGVWTGDVGIPWIGEGWKHPQWSWWEAATCLGSITAVVAATGSSSCLCWFLFVAPLVPQDCTGDLNMVQGNGNLWSALWFASFCGVRQFGDLGELGSSE